jgi:hypothetical protein
VTLRQVHGEEMARGMAGGGAGQRPWRGDGGLRTGIVETPVEGGSSGMVAARHSPAKAGRGSVACFESVTSGVASDRGAVETRWHLYR